MPELPEAEIATRELRTLLVGKKVLGFWTDLPKAILFSKHAQISRDVKNRKIKLIERRGKAILLWLSALGGRKKDGGKLLALHQKMSGRLLVLAQGIRDKHIHHRFLLSGGKELAFHDVRKFGRIWYGREDEVLRERFFAKLGQDPLALSVEEFVKILSQRKGGIKSILLRQDVFAGIGNIVADESLWKAKIHPSNQVQNLRELEKRRLFAAIKFVIERSIKLGGSSARDWLRTDGSQGGYYERRYVYQRESSVCSRCRKGIIKRIVVGARGTHFCPKCQVLKKLKP